MSCSIPPDLFVFVYRYSSSSSYPYFYAQVFPDHLFFLKIAFLGSLIRKFSGFVSGEVDVVSY